MTSDDRSPIAQAMGWVNQIITASLVLVVPPFTGNWLDRRLDTFPLWFIVGAVFGVVASGWHFYKIFVALTKEEERQ
jgi:F0F1-type ATP synthase assembly protein I